MIKLLKILIFKILYFHLIKILRHECEQWWNWSMIFFSFNDKIVKDFNFQNFILPFNQNIKAWMWAMMELSAGHLVQVNSRFTIFFWLLSIMKRGGGGWVCSRIDPYGKRSLKIFPPYIKLEGDWLDCTVWKRFCLRILQFLGDYYNEKGKKSFMDFIWPSRAISRKVGYMCFCRINFA